MKARKPVGNPFTHIAAHVAEAVRIGPIACYLNSSVLQLIRSHSREVTNPRSTVWFSTGC